MATPKKHIRAIEGPRLWKEAKKIIPGGSQLLSKRAEMALPEHWPAYFSKAKGVEVTDLDGNVYIDMSHMSVGTCTLGYADPEVNKAVKHAIDMGNMSTLNAPEEVLLAQEMIRIHPWAGGVRYARTGGEAVAIAVRIARAKSGKDVVAFSGYHGWHDWYLATNITGENLTGIHLSGLSSVGVPRGLKNTAIPFHYNNFPELVDAVERYDIGVIVMEPMRHEEPVDDFLGKVRRLADEKGIVLIFDEVSSGFRFRLGGIHPKFRVTPDIAVFGKSLSNGYPLSVIIGRQEVMSVAEDTFVSSTYFTERTGFVAALATIKKMRSEKAFVHIERIGKLILKGWQKTGKRYGLPIEVMGPPALATFTWKSEQALVLKTLFTQEMLKRGFLAGQSVYVSFAHQESHVEQYFLAVDEVFALIKGALSNGDLERSLEGPIAHAGFTRLTH